jgi:hypothetical protein
MSEPGINQHGTHNRCDARPALACVACHLIHVREEVIVWSKQGRPIRINWPEPK